MGDVEDLAEKSNSFKFFCKSREPIEGKSINGDGIPLEGSATICTYMEPKEATFTRISDTHNPTLNICQVNKCYGLESVTIRIVLPAICKSGKWAKLAVYKHTECDEPSKTTHKIVKVSKQV